MSEQIDLRFKAWKLSTWREIEIELISFWSRTQPRAWNTTVKKNNFCSE